MATSRKQMIAEILAEQAARPNVTTGAARPTIRPSKQRPASAPIAAARATQLLAQPYQPVHQAAQIAPVDAQMVDALGNIGLNVWAGLRQKKQEQQTRNLLADELALDRGEDPFQGDAIQPIEPPSVKGIMPKAPQELANPEGQTEQGNLDPFNRPVLKNPDGSVSTTSSFSMGTDKGETLLPSVVNGQRLSTQRPDGSTDFGPAIDHYKQTGENLGTFDTPENADKYANMLHGEQAAVMGLREPGFEDAGLADALLAQKKGINSYATAKADANDQEAPVRLEHDTSAMLDPSVAPLASQRLFPKPQDPYTLGENDIRFDGKNQKVAEGPKKAPPAPPATWSAPYTDEKGNVLQKNSATGEIRVATAAQKPEKDTGTWSEPYKDEAGNVLQKNSVTGEIRVATHAGTSTQETDPTKANAILAELSLLGATIKTSGRSRDQVTRTLNGLMAKYPDLSAADIAEKIASGQIDFNSQMKSTGVAATQAGKIETAVNELDSMTPQLIAWSRAVPRGSFVPLNKLMQVSEASISDPNLRQLRIGVNSMLNAYKILAARGGLSNEKQEAVQANLLSSADSPEALEAALQAFGTEAAIARAAARKATRYTHEGQEVDEPTGPPLGGTPGATLVPGAHGATAPHAVSPEVVRRAQSYYQ